MMDLVDGKGTTNGKYSDIYVLYNLLAFNTRLNRSGFFFSVSNAVNSPKIVLHNLQVKMNKLPSDAPFLRVFSGCAC